MTTEAWKYDADQHDPLTALRIPVTSSHPQWVYLAAFDRESDARPTEAEMGMLASYIDYQRQHWFGEAWQAKLMQRPFDIDGGHNTYVFHKYGADDWAYRQRTWDHGPMFWPPYDRKESLSLVALLDHIHTFGDHLYHSWAEWRSEHTEVFASMAGGAA